MPRAGGNGSDCAVKLAHQYTTCTRKVNYFAGMTLVQVLRQQPDTASRQIIQHKCRIALAHVERLQAIEHSATAKYLGFEMFSASTRTK